MFSEPRWDLAPPALPPALASWLTDTGSLTERLLQTGRAFSVHVLLQQQDRALADEASLLGIEPGAPVLARHVALCLDDIPVVVARSIALPDCPTWQAVLQRGNRSLGLSLFAKDSGIIREPMHYRMLAAPHPLFAMAVAHDPSSAACYPARRSSFALEGSTLNVCEIFLPALENAL